MPLWDAILINGVEIPEGLPAAVAPGVCVEGPWEWPYIASPQRGEFPVYPGYDGAGYIAQPYAAGVIPFYVTLSSPPCTGGTITQSNETFAWLNNAMETIREVCQPDQPSVLTRRRSLSPYSADETHTANAKLLNITPARPGRDTMRLVVEFTLLDGVWYGEEEEVALVEGSNAVTILGDTRTYNIDVDYSAPLGSPISLTNASNGYGYTVTNQPVLGPWAFTVDVLQRRLYRTSDPDQDTSSALTWGKQHLLRLDPGPQTIDTVLQGATLRYRPAYL